jgi:hypothetical protein
MASSLLVFPVKKFKKLSSDKEERAGKQQGMHLSTLQTALVLLTMMVTKE